MTLGERRSDCNFCIFWHYALQITCVVGVLTMTKCPEGKRFKPLPRRRGFWRGHINAIKQGIVILAEELPEQEDARNAAQAILIDHIESRLMQRFRRPALDPDGEFYAEFFDAYVKVVRTAEENVWCEIEREVCEALAEQPDRDLSEKEAAYLTYTYVGYIDQPPDSTEYYMNLAVFSRAYEELLKKKYGEQYTPGVFYRALRTHMYGFVMRLIAMDSLISVLLLQNMKSPERADKYQLLRPETVLDSCFMRLGEDDSFAFAPQFIDAVHEHTRENNMKKDAVGRIEDRGCPVLYSSERDAIIHFGIEELIAQHKAHMHRT